MTTLEEKRTTWMNAVRDHRDAVKLSLDTGSPIPNLSALLANLKATRQDYFDEFLDACRHENENLRKRFFIATAPLQRTAKRERDGGKANGSNSTNTTELTREIGL